MSNVKKNHEDLLKSGQIKLVVGDGRQGHAQNGPYHAIHVGAAAPSLPQAVSLLHALSLQTNQHTLQKYSKAKYVSNFLIQGVSY